MVIAKDAVYVLTVPSAMDRQLGVLPTPDAPLVRDLMLRLSSAAETVDKSPATRSDLRGCSALPGSLFFNDKLAKLTSRHMTSISHEVQALPATHVSCLKRAHLQWCHTLSHSMQSLRQK